MTVEDTNANTESEVISPYAIIQEIRTVSTPSSWVNVVCSFGYHDYYKTIAGINYVYVDSWYSSRINGTPWVNANSVGNHIILTVTYQRKSDLNYVSEIITIYP